MCTCASMPSLNCLLSAAMSGVPLKSQPCFCQPCVSFLTIYSTAVRGSACCVFHQPLSTIKGFVPPGVLPVSTTTGLTFWWIRAETQRFSHAAGYSSQASSLRRTSRRRQRAQTAATRATRPAGRCTAPSGASTLTACLRLSRARLLVRLQPSRSATFSRCAVDLRLIEGGLQVKADLEPARIYSLLFCCNAEGCGSGDGPLVHGNVASTAMKWHRIHGSYSQLMRHGMCKEGGGWQLPWSAWTWLRRRGCATATRCRPWRRRCESRRPPSKPRRHPPLAHR